MSKPTPGPYLEHGTAIYSKSMQDIDHEYYRGFDHIEPGAPGYLIAESIPHKPTRRLLIAAPDLLAIVKGFERKLPMIADPDSVPNETCMDVEVTWAEWSAIRAAIGKAEDLS